jgi:hypothetical protein
MECNKFQKYYNNDKKIRQEELQVIDDVSESKELSQKAFESFKRKQSNEVFSKNNFNQK